MNLRRASFVVACIAATALPYAAHVRGSAPPQIQIATSGSLVSMDQAVRMVEQRYHARVVKAQAEQDNGHTVYLLRLLNDSGRVWTVRVDAANGSVL
jgi:uncharacterized membrane protein YkoI